MVTNGKKKINHELSYSVHHILMKSIHKVEELLLHQPMALTIDRWIPPTLRKKRELKNNQQQFKKVKLKRNKSQ